MFGFYIYVCVLDLQLYIFSFLNKSSFDIFRRSKYDNIVHALVAPETDIIYIGRVFVSLVYSSFQNYIVFRKPTTRIEFNYGWHKSYSIQKPKNTRFLSSVWYFFSSHILIQYKMYYFFNVQFNNIHNIVSCNTCRVHRILYNMYRCTWKFDTSPLVAIHVYYSKVSNC